MDDVWKRHYDRVIFDLKLLHTRQKKYHYKFEPPTGVKERKLRDNTYKTISARYIDGGCCVEEFEPYEDYKSYIDEIKTEQRWQCRAYEPYEKVICPMSRNKECGCVIYKDIVYEQ